MKIKNDSDDDLCLEKTINLHNVVIKIIITNGLRHRTSENLKITSTEPAIHNKKLLQLC